MKNFITIEGCDGVGKTYQTRLLKEYCEQQGATSCSRGSRAAAT